MAGLLPAIHVFCEPVENKTWMPGTRPGMTKVAWKNPHGIGRGDLLSYRGRMAYFKTISVNG
jgi:hypothetical protein